MERTRVNAVQVVAVVGIAVAVLVSVASVALAMQLVSLLLLVLAGLRAFGRPERVLVARSRAFDVLLMLLLSATLGYLSLVPDL